MKAQGRRRGFVSWFVEPYRQIKLGLVFLVINLVFAVLILGVFGFYLWDVYKAIVVYFELSGDQGAQILDKLKVPALWGTGLIAFFILTTILVSVRYTHAIYGPLVSIHRFLEDVLNQRPVKPLNLRESDQLHDLALKLNRVAERAMHEQRQSSMIAVYRFLDQLLAGEKPKALEIRDSDFSQELVVKLNRLAEKLSGKS